jgi:hypothetical protein
MDSALESFVELMDSGGPIVVVVGLMALTPIMVLSAVVHELGHATVALARTQSLVWLRVGRYPGALRGRVGRLEYSIDHRFRKGEDIGSAAVVANMTRGERVAYGLAGPGANLIFSAALVPLFLAGTGMLSLVAVVAIAFSAYGAFGNLLSRQPGSDGRVVLAALRDEALPVHDDADDLGRWLALFTNPGDARLTSQRRLLFECVPQHGQAKLARAGWCWREIRPAPQCSEDARAAWKEQALHGLVGTDLAAAAAIELVHRRAVAGDEQVLTFAAELAGVDPGRPDVQSAFRYGAALHDVEAVMAEHGQRHW